MLLQLNAFLLRQGLSPIRAISTASLPDTSFALWTNNRLEPLEVADGDLLDAAVPGDVIVALVRRPIAPPAWQQFIQDALALPDFGRASSALGVILFCATGDSTPAGGPIRWLGWCFGFGWRVMRRRATDPRFGLLVALNALAPVSHPLPDVGDPPLPPSRAPRLSDLQYRTTAPFFQQTGHRAARDIPVEGFRIDRASDLVSAVGGRTADPLLPRVLGGRSVRFRAGVDCVADLVKLSEELRSRSSTDGYKQSFGWVDNITPVDDEPLIELLRQQLVADLLTRPVPSTVDALLPDDLIDVGDDRSIQYVLYPRERQPNACRTTLTVAMLSRLAAGLCDPARPDALLDCELRFLDEARECVGAATILECLCADLTVDGELYVVCDGDFYQVDRTFVQRIDDELSRLPESDLALPCYRGGTEGSYNESVGRADPDRFAVLDRSLIQLPDETGIEPCDLVGASGALVHVKRKGKSSVLSHLFLQAVNSCDTLRWSPEAKAQLREMIKARGASPTLVASALQALDRLEQGGHDIEVVFAFLGDWRQRTITSLPLFSRVSLVQAARRIGQLGYQPSFKLIDICQQIEPSPTPQAVQAR
jgi:uncharacterized protein (TIGR04141 family)